MPNTASKNRVIGAGVAGLAAGSYLDGAQYLVYPKLLDLVFSQLGFDRSEILLLRRLRTAATTYLPNGMSISIRDNLQIALENGEIDVLMAQQELADLVRKWSPVDESLQRKSSCFVRSRHGSFFQEPGCICQNSQGP